MPNYMNLSKDGDKLVTAQSRFRAPTLSYCFTAATTEIASAPSPAAAAAELPTPGKSKTHAIPRNGPTILSWPSLP